MKDKELEKRLAELESCVAKMQDYNGRLNHLEHDIEICKRAEEETSKIYFDGNATDTEKILQEMEEHFKNEPSLGGLARCFGGVQDESSIMKLRKYRAYRDLKFSGRVALAKECREYLKRESEKYNFTIEDCIENFMVFLQNKFNEFDEKESLCSR